MKAWEWGTPAPRHVVAVPRDVRAGDVIAYLGMTGEPVRCADVPRLNLKVENAGVESTGGADVENVDVSPRLSPLDPAPAIAGTSNTEDLTLADLDALPVGQDILDQYVQRWTKEGPGLWRDHTYPAEYPPFQMDAEDATLYYRYHPFRLPPVFDRKRDQP